MHIHVLFSIPTARRASRRRLPLSCSYLSAVSSFAFPSACATHGNKLEMPSRSPRRIHLTSRVSSLACWCIGRGWSQRGKEQVKSIDGDERSSSKERMLTNEFDELGSAGTLKALADSTFELWSSLSKLSSLTFILVSRCKFRRTYSSISMTTKLMKYINCSKSEAFCKVHNFDSKILETPKKLHVYPRPKRNDNARKVLTSI